MTQVGESAMLDESRRMCGDMAVVSEFDLFVLTFSTSLEFIAHHSLAFQRRHQLLNYNLTSDFL